MIPLNWLLIISGVLFAISVAGMFINRKNLILLLMCVELLLLIAIIAAISLTMRKRANLKQQDVARQVAVRREDRVRVVHVPPEKPYEAATNDMKAVAPEPSPKGTGS